MARSFERSLHIVASAFQLVIDSEDVVRRLDDLLPAAHQDHAIAAHHALSVGRVAGGWQLVEDDSAPVLVDTEDAVVDLVERRVHELALEALADRTKIHAGCGVWSGRRFLVVGRGGAGKTTLMTRLLMEDCEVEGDELVLLREDEAVAYPRRFGVRRLTLSLVPRVGALAPELTVGPGALEPGGYHVLALDPRRLDRDWRIGTGPVDAVFLLGPRVQGESQVARCDTTSVLARLMDQSAAPAAGAGAWVRHLSSLVRRARFYELRAGDLDSAVHTVRQYVTYDR